MVEARIRSLERETRNNHSIGGTMKNFLRFVFVIMIVLGIQHSALAQDAFKIGVVNIQKIQDESLAFEKERNKLKQVLEVKQKELVAEENALRQLQEDYEKQSMMLSLEAQEEKKREYDAKNRYYEYLKADYTATAQQLQAAAVTRLQIELSSVIREIGLKGNYTVIVEKRATLYHEGVIDITAEVISAYDKVYSE
jgi:outer membrane protein